MGQLIINEEVKSILKQMDVANNLKIVNKWNKVDTSLHLTQFVAIGIGATAYFSQSTPLMYSIFFGTVIGIGSISLLGHIHNKTEGKFYTFLPGYKKVQEKAAPAINLWLSVLKNKNNQLQMINFFEDLIEYKYGITINEKQNEERDGYNNRLKKLKHLFSNGIEDKVKIQLSLLPLLQLYYKVEFELDLKKLRNEEKVLNIEDKELNEEFKEKEIGNTRYKNTL